MDGEKKFHDLDDRKLRCTKSGHVTVIGYLDPDRDPQENDLKNDVELWTSRPHRAPHGDVEKSKFILSLIGDQVSIL
jgi:hypothetical protein